MLEHALGLLLREGASPLHDMSGDPLLRIKRDLYESLKVVKTEMRCRAVVCCHGARLDEKAQTPFSAYQSAGSSPYTLVPPPLIIFDAFPLSSVRDLRTLFRVIRTALYGLAGLRMAQDHRPRAASKGKDDPAYFGHERLQP